MTAIECSRGILAAAMVAAGSLHFAFPRQYARMIPAYLPLPRVLVTVSGLCEIAGGALLIFPATRLLAALGLIVLLIAVFPVNVAMLTNPPRWAAGRLWVLWARLPLQPLLMVLVWWVR